MCERAHWINLYQDNGSYGKVPSIYVKFGKRNRIHVISVTAMYGTSQKYAHTLEYGDRLSVSCSQLSAVQ